MSEFNLIPGDYAREQTARRRLRLALVSFAVLCGFIVLARSALGMLVAIEKDKVAQLEVKKRHWQESKRKTEKYVEEVKVAERQLAALDELRGRDQLRLFLEALDTAYVNKVWFDEIRYYRRDSVPAGTPAQQKAAPRVEQRAGTSCSLNSCASSKASRRSPISRWWTRARAHTPAPWSSTSSWGSPWIER